MEPKKRSAFGLIVAILAALDAFLMNSNMSKMVSSSTGAEALGMMIGARLVKPFLTFAALSAIACFIGYFARFKWGYLTGAVLLVIGILQLPAIAGVPTEPAILAVLMFIAFIVDHSKQKKQAQEAVNNIANVEEPYEDETPLEGAGDVMDVPFDRDAITTFTVDGDEVICNRCRQRSYMDRVKTDGFCWRCGAKYVQYVPIKSDV